MTMFMIIIKIFHSTKKSQIDPKNVPDLTGFYVFYSLNVLHLLPKMQNRIFLELLDV